MATRLYSSVQFCVKGRPPCGRGRQVHHDSRGHFFESYNRRALREATGVGVPWPLEGEPLMSDKDRRGTPLGEAETYP